MAARRNRRNMPKMKTGNFVCADADWEMIREMAQVEGSSSVSRWLVERTLSINPAYVAGNTVVEGLKPEEERHQYELVLSIAKGLGIMEQTAGRGADSFRPLLLGIFKMLEDLMVAQGRITELNQIHRLIEEVSD